jgi:hypothetical protein
MILNVTVFEFELQILFPVNLQQLACTCFKADMRLQELLSSFLKLVLSNIGLE